MLALLLLISGIQYTTLRSILGILGGILGIFGYFGEFFSGILVYHYPPWPTLWACILRGRNLFWTPRGERTMAGSNAPEDFLATYHFHICNLLYCNVLLYPSSFFTTSLVSTYNSNL